MDHMKPGRMYANVTQWSSPWCCPVSEQLAKQLSKKKILLHWH